MQNDHVENLYSGTDQPIYLPKSQIKQSSIGSGLKRSRPKTLSINLTDLYSDLNLSLPSNTQVLGLENNFLQTEGHTTSHGFEMHEFESPCPSPSRSKSSSCNTLDSIDSGLESSNSNKDQMSSQDSLDGISMHSFVYELGHFTCADERSRGQVEGQSVDISSPTIQHSSVLYEDNEPPLVAYRKRRKSFDQVRWHADILCSVFYFSTRSRSHFDCCT